MKDLFAQCSITLTLALLAGRRDTGGRVTVRLSLRTPLVSPQIDVIEHRTLALGAEPPAPVQIISRSAAAQSAAAPRPAAAAVAVPTPAPRPPAAAAAKSAAATPALPAAAPPRSDPATARRPEPDLGGDADENPEAAAIAAALAAGDAAGDDARGNDHDAGDDDASDGNDPEPHGDGGDPGGAAGPAAAGAPAGPPKPQVVIQPGTPDEDEDPHSVDYMISNNVLELEQQMVEAALLRNKTDESLLDRKRQIDIKLQLLILLVQTEQLSLESYSAMLGSQIKLDRALAERLRSQGKNADAIRVLKRVKLMEDELSNPEE